MSDIIGLGIESSCDETAIAVVKNGEKVLSQPMFSQVALHKKYGGVIPELASRSHLEKITFLLEEALSESGIEIQQIDYIATTVKPGLVGSLLVGYQTALALHWKTGARLLPVHHLEAHLYAPLLSGASFEYPFLGLLLSGGNSAIYRISAPGEVKVLGDTIDDAAGEALDKAAAMLGLPYPGGPQIEKEAGKFLEVSGESEASLREKNPLAIPLRDLPRNEIRFSFSGLKTSLLYLLKKNSDEYTREALSFYFQQRIIDAIIRNVEHAVKREKVLRVVAAGGVTANSMLRSALEALADSMKFSITFPERSYSTDNAAMVAAAGYIYFRAQKFPEQNFVSSDNKFEFKPLRE